MTSVFLNNPKWRNEALCADTNIDFFDFENYREKMNAKALCGQCPVRMNCISDALQNEDLYGMWGGVDEQEIRRALSVDQNGKPAKRRLPPRCPNCLTERLAVLEKRRTKSNVQCPNCKLSWWTRRTISKRMRAFEE